MPRAMRRMLVTRTRQVGREGGGNWHAVLQRGLRRTCMPPWLAARAAPQIKRTEGVSTTDIVGRMLMCSRPSFKEHDKRVRAACGGWG